MSRGGRKRSLAFRLIVSDRFTAVLRAGVRRVQLPQRLLWQRIVTPPNSNPCSDPRRESHGTRCFLPLRSSHRRSASRQAASSPVPPDRTRVRPSGCS